MQILMKKFPFKILMSKTLLFYWCFFNDCLIIFWKIFVETASISMQTLVIIIFFVLVSKTLILHCCFSDDSLITHWSLIDGTVKISIEAKLILIFFCANLWNVDAFLLLNWRFVEGTLMNYWRHRLEIKWSLMFCFECANLRNIDIPLVLQWCLVDASLRENWWNSHDMDSNNNDHLSFFLLISEFLMFHCYSLMIPWKDIDEQWRFRCKQYWSKKTIVLIFQTLIFRCCFLEFLLVSLWTIFDETLMLSIQTPMIRSFFRKLISETFMFHYCVSDDSLMILRRGIVETAGIWMRNLMIINSSVC